MVIDGPTLEQLKGKTRESYHIGWQNSEEKNSYFGENSSKALKFGTDTEQIILFRFAMDAKTGC